MPALAERAERDEEARAGADAVGARVDGTANGGDANPTAVNAVSNRGGDSKDAWSRRDEAWAHAFTLASEEASSDGGERPTK